MLQQLLLWVLIFSCNISIVQAKEKNSVAAEQASHKDALFDSIINIEAVTIATDRLKQLGIGNHTETLDSASSTIFQSGTLTDVLNHESAIFIRSYGLGSLGTISIRGASSTQTAMLWNGFNIQSPMNALYDASLLPVFFLDEVQVQHGSSGALFGSGAIGGSIHLNNKTVFNNGWQVKYVANYGSFNTLLQGASVGFSNKKWMVQTKAFYKQAENNFRFKNIAEFGSPMQRQENAALQQWGILHEQSFNLLNENTFAKKNLLQFKFLHQKNERDIPPSMTMNTSEAQQADAIVRATASWDYAIKKWETTLRSAYFNEQINFVDPASNLDEHYTAHTAIIESEHKIYLHKRHLLHGGINYTFHRAITKNYLGNNPAQNRAAVFASYRYTSGNNKLMAVASIRKEVINNQRVPFTPSIASEYQVLKFLRLKTNVSRSFRVPSFNDWYWTQGGNPNLKSETGWGGEAGLVFSKQKNYWHFESEQTFFMNTISERIIWLPNDIGIWTPENVARVNSTGWESSLKMQYAKNNFSTSFSIKYALVNAVNGNDIPNKNEAGKQLIYIPKHKAVAQIVVAYKKTLLQYNHQLNGEMFYTADNSKSLPLYHMGNVVLSHQFVFKQMTLQVFGKANNLWGEAYQVIVWRPMPLQNFEVGIQFNFNHKTNVK